jgi:LPS-assembly protein
LDDYTDPVRLNRLDFHRIWSQLNLDIDFRWFDDVIQRRFSTTNDTLQRLPFVGFAATKQRIFSSLFFINLDSSYNYFYRQDGDRSQRLDIHPRFYLPLSLKNYFTFEPSVGLRETLWYFYPELSASIKDDRFNRELYDFRIDLTSDISRSFKVGGTTIDRMKHTVKPQIVYEYIPKVDQSNLPQFDGIDRIEPQNRVTYSITNFFISRSPRKSVSQKDRDASLQYDYRQFGRFKLEQSYDINEARRENLLPGEKKQPFSPIIAELDLSLSPYILMDADAAWDIYESRLQTGNIGMSLTDKRDNRLYTEYRYTRGETKTIKADLFLNITASVATGFEYEKNLRSGQRLKAGVNLIYRAQCWSIDTRYLNEPSNTKIQFTINLTGLGGVGGTF